LLVYIGDRTLFLLRTAFLADLLGGLAGGLIDQEVVSLGAGLAYNGQIPGLRLHIKQGDRVRINVRNRLSEKTTVHWHGLILPNQMDGPSEIAQAPIRPRGAYAYEFTATQHGTYFYHPHAEPDRTQALGLYGALIIDPANPADETPANHDYVIQLQEWLMREGLTFPAMPMDGMQPNYFTINGKAYPCDRSYRNEGRRDAEGALHRHQ
jgi:FtsP/CotA-like multicopper oxidase with cupredoxin domain